MKKPLEGRTILILLLLAFELYVVVLGSGYGPNSRIFPLGIGIPTLVLTVLVLLSVWRPEILRSAEVRLSGSSSATPVPEEEEAGSEPAMRVLRMVVWLVVACLGIAFLGFRLAAPVFVLLFGRIEGHVRWIPCILTAFFCWAFIVGYFELYMRYSMFKGVLFGDLLPIF
jgi:hypothetical protein